MPTYKPAGAKRNRAKVSNLMGTFENHVLTKVNNQTISPLSFRLQVRCQNVALVLWGVWYFLDSPCGQIMRQQVLLPVVKLRRQKAPCPGMMKRARRRGQGEMNPIQDPVKHHFISAERSPKVHSPSYSNIQGFGRSRQRRINVRHCSCKITINSQLRQHRGLRWRNQSCRQSCPVSNLRQWMQQLVHPCNH